MNELFNKNDAIKYCTIENEPQLPFTTIVSAYFPLPAVAGSAIFSAPWSAGLWKRGRWAWQQRDESISEFNENENTKMTRSPFAS